MIFDNETKQEARNIVKKHHLLFLLSTTGQEHLTDDDIEFLKKMGIDIDEYLGDDFVTDAYNIGLTRGGVKAGQFEAMPISEFRAQAKPYVTEEARYSIEYVRSQVASAVNRAAAKVAQDVEGAIREGNMGMANFLIDEASAPIVVKGIEENRTRAQVASELFDNMDEYNRDWKRVSTTELNNAKNHGAAELYRQQNPNKKSDEILVFKIVTADEALCKHCAGAYGVGTPIVYTLKQLQANGSNYGKRAAAYLPVVGAHHPNCRCHLNMLPDGFGFGDDGNMEFKNADYRHKTE